MTFREDEIAAFQDTFARSKPEILKFDGCSDVRLLQDENNPCIMMTYSIWSGEDALNAYRHSEFFQDTWTKTKALFDAKPEAWSLDQIN
ncbi:antibiotic biosynthesis monooxygenase [Salibacteraceae bacterium]|jgi:quinol monooxygenase YgiN|nr:antibiotic biosynthesis monooxygenase [Flavobacteriales bacterium]MDB9701355.1 antibiotic biosynthesis monooxygenase [Salibacteraceae bacterium]